MLRRILFLAPFVAALALVAGAMRLLAFLAGQPYVPYNPDLEGAKIVASRDRARDNPSVKYDLIFGGTSRTLADYDTEIAAAELGRRCRADRHLTSYNLGRLALFYSVFLDYLRTSELPKLLVLEFSPHVLLDYSPDGKPRPPQEARADWLGYEAYRSRLKLDEVVFTGAAESALGLSDLIQMNPGHLVLIVRALRRHPDNRLARLYYMLRSTQGEGVRIGDAGQVLYRIYFPGRDAAKLVDDVESEYGKYVGWLASPPDPDAWRSFTGILDLFASGGQVVVVRPPVAPEIYALENKRQAAMIADVAAYLRGRGVAYIDMNGGDYFSTDRTHIDWYDTARLSRDVARRLAEVVRPGILSPSPCSSE